MTVKIVTDSTSYLPEELKEKYDIKVVSLNITMNGKSYKEVEIDNEKFYEEMEASKEIPTSSQPALDEMINTFENILSEGFDIAAIFLSSEMSGTFSSAHLVKEMVLENYPDRKIEIIDSKTNCMQMGFEVLEAAKSANEGKSLEEVKEATLYVRENSRFLFAPESLTYLKKGGRIGGDAALFGSILQIKPILTVEKGVTTVFDKVRTKKKAVNTMVEKVLKDAEERGVRGITVHHINCEEEGKALAEILKEKLKVEVHVEKIGPVIGLHVGPGSIGVAYYTK